jgi:hypothetical protein
MPLPYKTIVSFLLGISLFSPAPVRATVPHIDPPPRTPRSRFERLKEVAGVESAQSRPLTPSLGPAYLRDISKVAFQSWRSHNSEIYIANGDGSGETRLTDHAAADILPRLNRGASRIVFSTNRDGNYEIYSMNIVGGDLQRLTNNNADDLYPFWSPDGSRIAFASTRDGNNEIYAMNADGSGVTRLTNNAATDSEPAWSPDGAKIAFVSYRSAPANTGGRVWVMNADGSNPQQIGAINFSFDPIWSPDGTKIAFDGDINNDGWLDILWLSPTGGPATVIVMGNPDDMFNPPIDRYMGGWSPDGQYISLTAGLYGWDYSTGGWRRGYTYAEYAPLYGMYSPLLGNGFEIETDWQSTDLTPPTTVVQDLPAVSPADFTVIWTGSSTDGPATQFSYEVQVREGLTGTWAGFATAFWNTPNSKVHHGQSGRTYYFRGRGIDQVLNIEPWPADFDAWTTVETLPPVSSMNALAPLTHDRSIGLSWNGTDLGGSGVAAFDLEYRIDASPGWMPLLNRTPLTTLVFTGEFGHMYSYRIRAIDAAGNIEAWRPGDGDAHVLLAQSTVGGHVYDNAGIPVRGAQVGSWPVANPDQAPTLGDGAYDRIVLTTTTWLTTAIPSPYVGALPTARIRTVMDTVFDFYLPPFDNVIQNSEFETRLTSADWFTTGLTPPRMTGASRHTGERGITVGGYEFSDPEAVSRSAPDDPGGVLALDLDGTPHLVWAEAEGAQRRLYHSTRLASGEWITPELIASAAQSETGSAPQDYRPALAIDPAGTVHVLWRSWPDGMAYYAQRPVSGPWTSPHVVASGLDADSLPRLAIDPAGVAHIVWHDGNGSRRDIFYTRRDAAGTWPATENLTGADPYATESRLPAIRVDVTGTATLAWQNGVGQYIAGFYATRPATGAWSAPLTLLLWPFALSEPRIDIDAFGASHLAWRATLANGMNAIAYATARGAQVSPLKLVYTSPLALTLDRIIVDRAGTPHLALSRSDGETLHVTPGAGNTWTVTNLSASPAVVSRRVDLAATSSGVWAVWREQLAAGEAVAQCKKWTVGAGWVDYGVCALALGGAPVLVAGPDDILHLGYASTLEAPGQQMHAAWLDAPVGVSAIAQYVTLPITLNTPGLSFLYRLEGVVSDVAPLFAVTAASAFSTTDVFTAATLTGAPWQHVWRDMSAFAGQSITLTFAIDPRDGSGGVRLALDEVSLGSTAPDLWVDSALPVEIRPETTQTMTLRYGNRGGGNAPGAAITMTLPPGLTLDSAEPPPVSVAPALVWQLPAISSGAVGPSIALTLSIGAGAAGSVTTPTIAIASAIPELELANNDWRTATFVGYRAYLPVIRAP